MDATNIRNRVDTLRRSFSGSQLVIIGVLVVVAGVGMLSFMKWVSQPSYSVLVSGGSTRRPRRSSTSWRRKASRTSSRAAARP